MRIQFDAISASAGLLSGEQGSPATGESVQNDAVPFRTVENRIANKGQRLWCRMAGECGILIPAETAHAGVFPDIGSAPAKATEFDVVDVLSAAVFVDEYELVGRSVQGAHAGVVFRPNADVLEFGVYVISGVGQFTNMPPIHAHEMDRPVEAKISKVHQGASEEICELSLGHLTGCHRKLTMSCLA